MNKEREIAGVKVFVAGETYNEYKGTLQEQLEEKDKEIKRLNNIIDEIEKELDLNLKFKVIGVKRLKDKLKELKEGK